MEEGPFSIALFYMLYVVILLGLQLVGTRIYWVFMFMGLLWNLSANIQARGASTGKGQVGHRPLLLKALLST